MTKLSQILWCLQIFRIFLSLLEKISTMMNSMAWQRVEKTLTSLNMKIHKCFQISSQGILVFTQHPCSNQCNLEIQVFSKNNKKNLIEICITVLSSNQFNNPSNQLVTVSLEKHLLIKNHKLIKSKKRLLHQNLEKAIIHRHFTLLNLLFLISLNHLNLEEVITQKHLPNLLFLISLRLNSEEVIILKHSPNLLSMI